jgi:hypothetical protein
LYMNMREEEATAMAFALEELASWALHAVKSPTKSSSTHSPCRATVNRLRSDLRQSLLLALCKLWVLWVRGG